MPRMKILVRFMDLPAISEYVGSKMKPQGELVDKEKKKTPPFFLIWSCPTCRTGPAELNQRICVQAISRGWRWNPYGVGFTRDPISLRDTDRGEIHAVHSESEVFEFVGLPYQEPSQRR